MDPSQFHLDPERTVEVLFAIVVLSFFVERFLAIVFEHRWYVDRLGGKGFKTPIAFGVSYLVCRHWDFDAISTIISKETISTWGQIITAGVVAGGSKASIKLFERLGAISIQEARRREEERKGVGDKAPPAGQGAPPEGAAKPAAGQV